MVAYDVGRYGRSVLSEARCVYCGSLRSFQTSRIRLNRVPACPCGRPYAHVAQYRRACARVRARAARKRRIAADPGRRALVNSRKNAQKRRRYADPDYRAKVLERRSRYRGVNREKVRAYSRGGQLGLTPSQIEAVKMHDGHRCGVCGANPGKRRDGTDGLFVEHHHASGVVRGAICCRCNYGIGVIDLWMSDPVWRDTVCAFVQRRGEKYPSTAAARVALRSRLIADLGACEICGDAPPPNKNGASRLHLEHHHGSRRVRGLVCQTCNRAIGFVDGMIADPTWLDALVHFATRPDRGECPDLSQKCR